MLMKMLAAAKKPFVMALFALIVAPHVALGHPAKLTRPVWVNHPAPVAFVMNTPHPLPPWAAN